MIKKEHLIEVLSNKNINNFNIYTNDKYIGVKVSAETAYSLIKILRDTDNLKFNQLIDITAIDYPSRELRFEVVYLLLSLSLNQRIIVKVFLQENQTIQSITSLYKSANWYERECYDLFGIKFDEHPDLRRIMTDYNFDGHPLRKDFPLTGHTEVRYDDLEKRVVYDLVNLTQEYRYFDYSSPWEGLSSKFNNKEDKSKKERNK